MANKGAVRYWSTGASCGSVRGMTRAAGHVSCGLVSCLPGEARVTCLLGARRVRPGVTCLLGARRVRPGVVFAGVRAAVGAIWQRRRRSQPVAAATRPADKWAASPAPVAVPCRPYQPAERPRLRSKFLAFLLFGLSHEMF